MYESFTMRMMLDCKGCGLPVPVNGVAERADCSRCGVSQAIPREVWSLCFCDDAFYTVMGYEAGRDAQGTMQGHGVSVSYAHGRGRPRCQACQGPELDLDDLAKALGAGGVPCPACGDRITVRPADDLCRAINPESRFLVGETVASAEVEALQKKRAPVVFSCMSCGGALQVDGSERTVTCSYCSSSNYLPDGLWQQLNPVPTASVFFLVCEYGPGSLPVAFAQARTPGLSEEVYAALAEHQDARVRETLVRNPSLSIAELHRRAGDGSPKVQEAARARLDELAAKGVDITPPKRPGFFSKLFGR
jgi:DNA-directed RNA polymerase subunit RPC12/RpoP